MIDNIKDFNEKYNSKHAEECRAKISELTFNIQYLQIRVKALTDQLNKVHAEYMATLGVPQNGEDETK